MLRQSGTNVPVVYACRVGHHLSMMIADYYHPIRCSTSCNSSFRIRLYTGPYCPVIVATAPDTSDTTIDPEIDSYLAADVAARHPDILPDGQAFVWIAQSRLGDYARVTFDTFKARAVVNHRLRRRWLGTPTKRAVTREEIEAMIGERP